MFTHQERITHSSYSISQFIRRPLLLLMLSLLAGPLAAQNERDMPTLELGKPLERELVGGQAHSYSIKLAANQFLHVVVEQKGIDVVITLFAPDGKLIVEIDGQHGTHGQEPLRLITERAGRYRIEVRSLERRAAPGIYEVKIEGLRAATNVDRRRFAALALLAEGVSLREQKTLEAANTAIKKFEAAVQMFHALRTPDEEVSALRYLASTFHFLGEKQKALEHYNQALPILRAINDQAGEGATLVEIGFIHSESREAEQALKMFDRALPLLQTVGDSETEAQVLDEMRVICERLGDLQKQLRYSLQVLPLRHARRDGHGEGIALNNIGKAYKDLGEFGNALLYLQKALLVNRAANNRPAEAATLNNIAGVYLATGEAQKALDYYNQSLLIRRATGDRKGEAVVLDNVGGVYVSLGEAQKALEYSLRALAIFRELKDRREEGVALGNVGARHIMAGKPQEALPYYQEALAIARLENHRRAEAYFLHGLGRIYLDLGETGKSLEHLTQALSIFRASGDRRGEAHTLHNIGLAQTNLGQFQDAIGVFNQLIPLWQAIGGREGEAKTLYRIAEYEKDRGNLDGARSRIETALNIVESLRMKIGGNELRASYLAEKRQEYDFYIDLLMLLHRQRPGAGFDSKALEASERSRARSLLELLTEAGADIHQGVEPSLLANKLRLQQLLNAAAERQRRLSSNTGTGERFAEASQEVERRTTELQQVEARIRQTSPRYAALTQPQPLTLKEIQTRVLDEDTLLLEYSLGKEHSYLWAVTPTSITSFELPKRDEIEVVARQVYALLTDTKRWDNESAGGQRQLTREKAQTPYAPDGAIRLSQMLLGPVASQLGNRRLLVVSDGALQYIPFAALPVPVGSGSMKPGEISSREKSTVNKYQPLAVEHEIVSLPSASTIAVLRKEVKERKPAEKTVAILADPVFESDDERVRQVLKIPAAAPPNSHLVAKTRELPLGMSRAATESGLSGVELRIPRLPATRDEARQILSLFPPTQSKGSFDFDASRQTATSGELSQYRYVHFATHGFLDSLNPELSGIVLSMVDEKGNPQDGFLRAHEIFNLKLPAELVVLSACQTGLGKEVKGEGLVGLTRGFMYAGAPRVVVSLWSVNDEATAELMARFYRGMLKDNQRPAAALRAAQISLLKERRWRSPFYWAAFTIQGEWR